MIQQQDVVSSVDVIYVSVLPIKVRVSFSLSCNALCVCGNCYETDLNYLHGENDVRLLSVSMDSAL